MIIFFSFRSQEEQPVLKFINTHFFLHIFLHLILMAFLIAFFFFKVYTLLKQVTTNLKSVTS